MKKAMAFLLALVLIFTCVLASASAPITDYSLEEKWDLQMQGSGFKGNLSFTVEGDEPIGMELSLWQMLKMLLPGLSVDVNSMPRNNNRDTRISVQLGGTEVGSAKVLTDGEQTVLSSNMLDEDAYHYKYGQGFDLLQLFANEEDQWPDLKKTLLRVLMADDAWKAESAEVLSGYMSRIALWMQEYMVVSGESTENGYETHMTCRIPADKVKVEIKRLLSQIYEDEELLRLLGQVLTRQEMNTYLNSDNRDIFFIMLDLLPMEGDVEIHRVYDQAGNALLDQIVLPFADVSPWTQLSMTMNKNGDVVDRVFALIYRDGRKLDVDLRQMEEGIVTGAVRMDIADAEGSKGVRAFTFNCAYDAGEETYDLEQDKCQHLSDLSVLIKPTAEDTTGIRETTLSIRKDMVSKSSRRAATYITLDCTLTDQETGSVLGMLFTCHTASPWTPETIATLEADVTDLNAMADEDVLELTQLMKLNVEGFFSSLMMQAVPELMEE